MMPLQLGITFLLIAAGVMAFFSAAPVLDLNQQYATNMTGNHESSLDLAELAKYPAILMTIIFNCSGPYNTLQQFSNFVETFCRKQTRDLRTQERAVKIMDSACSGSKEQLRKIIAPVTGA